MNEWREEHVKKPLNKKEQGNEWMNEWMNEWVNEGRFKKLGKEWMNEWINERGMNETNESMDEWVNSKNKLNKQDKSRCTRVANLGSFLIYV